ncbi:hypothetical protein D0Z00_001917 [Geotrichum galactomycetum]|uniref:Uncharacterized protein n=1 Tax=Geotrichum galactomycetum TaxID=27317 RepID=A0ACB6V5K4_9ASCO|nr:hypothetical protein D0Z00_001917 [Geotrichum candidum]
MSIPTTTRGVFTISNKEHKLFNDAPVPELPEDLLLVKVAAIAINPVDWKFPSYGVATPDAGVGCDFSGTVIKVGSKVTGFNVGDNVFSVNSAYQLPNKNLLGTAFSEYVFAEPNLSFKANLKAASASSDAVVPAGPVNTFEAAAAVPLAALTAGLALSHHFANKIVYNADGTITTTVPDAANKYIVIWGGATSVGQYGIQIAKAAGFKVITTASPSNFDYLKSVLGADEVFDYRDASTGDKIKAIVSGGKLVHVFDPVSLPESWKSAYQLIPEDAGDIKIVSTLPTEEYDVGSVKANVKSEQEFVFMPSHNRFDLETAQPESDGQRQYVNASQFIKAINARIAQGKFLSNPFKIYEKQGVEYAEEAILSFKDANVSAYKYVVKL